MPWKRRILAVLQDQGLDTYLEKDVKPPVARQWRGSSVDQKICILIRTRGNPYPWICQARIFPTDQSPTDMGMSMDRSMDMY